MSDPNSILVIKKVTHVYVVLKLTPFTTIGRRGRSIDEIDFPKVLFMEIPLRLDFDESIILADNSLNSILLKNVEAISGAIMEKADEQGFPRPDSVQYELEMVTGNKADVDHINAKWELV